MIIISDIYLIQPKYKVVNPAGEILCYAPKSTYKSVRNQLSSVVNFRDRNTVDFAIRIIDNKNNEISVVFKELKGFDSMPDNDTSIVFKNPEGRCASDYNILSRTYLQLDEPEFNTVPPDIGYFIQLTALSLECLELTNLPYEIGKLVNLVDLYISENNLTDLPMSLKKLKKLKCLDMSYNSFPEIPRVAAKIISLKKLNIHRTHIYRTLRYTDSINALKQKIPHLLIHGE